MRKILEKCPTCDGELVVSELRCTQCDTVIQGRYAPCPFCQLSAEDLAFLVVFVKNRGNVKEMERELGVSYWAIRGRLNEVIGRLGFEEPSQVDDAGAGRREVLAQVERGELKAAEAAERLAKLR
jgi:hypothetical protein